MALFPQCSSAGMSALVPEMEVWFQYLRALRKDPGDVSKVDNEERELQTTANLYFNIDLFLL